jgi:predicted 3-demethylubiquinone-9 3-methyltransferase (glyoxalase superfamily)
MLTNPNGSIESSYHNVDIKTTPKSLIDLCTKYDIPFYSQNDGEDKTNFDFEFEADGIQFLVYDWKEYRSLSLNEVVSFHIGAKDRSTSNEAYDILQNELFNINI